MPSAVSEALHIPRQNPATMRPPHDSSYRSMRIWLLTSKALLINVRTIGLAGLRHLTGALIVVRMEITASSTTIGASHQLVSVEILGSVTIEESCSLATCLPWVLVPLVVPERVALVSDDTRRSVAASRSTEAIGKDERRRGISLAHLRNATVTTALGRQQQQH